MATASANDVNFETFDFDSVAMTSKYIDKGAFGDVYGPFLWNSKECAFKRILISQNTSDSFKKNFGSRQNIWTSLKHKNLVEIHHISLKEKAVYLVMEYAIGGSLWCLLHKSAVSFHASNWAMQIAEGMLYLHENSIVHRDLKSSNIMLMKPVDAVLHKEMTLKITDFDEVKEHNHTTTMSFRGTVAYMAPEILTTQRFSKASDVWSYGVVIWEMLARKQPYSGVDVGAMMRKALSGELTLSIPEHITEAYKELLRDCWCHDTKNRPSFKKIIEELSSIDSREVAATFLEPGSMKAAGKLYEVTKPSPVGKGPGKTSAVQEVPNTIEVSGIPEMTSEEFLRMYFENKKRSGGGDIKTMTFDKQEGMATITFCDTGAVLKILEKEEHKIGTEVLQVTALESLTPDLIDQVCAVRVSNIPPTISQDFLEVYFESAKRSGGEEFDEFLFDKDGRSAVVVYKSPEVCRRVTGRSHQLESVQLVLEALKPAPPSPIVVGETDERKLLVGDLPPDFKDEDLRLFLENAAGCPITQFNRGPLPDLVLLDFKSIPNYASLRKLVASRPFRDQMIFVQKVKPTTCVLVHGNKSFSDEVLSLHFENPKRSGGGEVKGIRRDANGDVIIEFHDRKVIPIVLKTKQVIGGQPLKTEQFHDCLTGSSRRRKVRIPEDVAKIRIYGLVNKVSTIMASNFDARRAKFLQKGHATDYFKELFENKKLEVFWSVKGQDLELSGIAYQEIIEALSLLNSEIQCATITLDVYQLVLMKQEKWKGFKKDLEDRFKIIEVTEDMHVSTVTVVSTRDSTDQIENEIRDFLKHHTILEQFIPMEGGKVAYIEQFLSQEIDDVQNQMSAEGVVIEVMQKKDSAGVLVRGTKSGLEKAVKRLFEVQQPILSTTKESYLYGVTRYFSSHRGKESKEKIETKNKVIVQIAKQPKNSGSSGANGGIIEKSTVSLNGSVIKVMKGNVAECRVKAMVIPIGEDLKHTDGAAKAVVEAGGQTIEDECQAHVKTSGKLLSGQIYDSKPGSLSCAGIIHVALPPWQTGTKNEVNCLEDGMWKALEKAEQKGWTSLAISGGTNYPPATTAKTIVDIVAEFLDERKNFKVEIRLIDSSDQVVNHFHETLIKKFGKDAVKIGETEQSSQLLASPVAVGTTPDQLSLIQTNYQPGKDTATLLTPEGVEVTLIQGSIAAQQVDVIVNTASKDLNLTQGAVSNSILQAAGANLQVECKTKMPNGLSPGQILMTTGYSLKCKSVYHGACDQWDGGKGKAEQVIRDLLKNAFANGHRNQMTSIAIPALGTGNLGTPRDIVSAIMYAEAEEFSKGNPTTTLKDIRFVVFDKPTIDVFQQHVNRLCNPSIVTIDKTLKNKQKRQLKQEGAGSSASVTPERTARPAQDETEAAEADISLDIPLKTVKIKSLVMEIKEGDITQENTDAIVNSTNKDLNLSGGAVTQAILKAGGRSIADECKKLGKTNKNGVAVTGAGKLKCKHIIHLAIPEKVYLGNAPEGKAWEERIFHCLKEAEHMKLTSVAFPLLGTGIRNTSASEMAVNIVNAVGEFAYGCKPKHLKNIRVTIFQPTMVDEFFTALQKRLSEKKSTKSVWGRFTGWLSSFVSLDPSGNKDDNDDFEMVEDPKNSPLVDYKCIFRVYGQSQTVIDKVLEELESLVKEAVTDKVLDSSDQQEAIAKLTPEQIRQLERDAANHQVKATVEKGRKLNRIRLQGDAKDIANVILNVAKILNEVEVAELKRNEAERIAQLAHWEYKDEDDGSFESYPTEINAIIEQAFKSKVGFAQWEENDGQFKIDFKANTEENLKNQQKTEVRRIGDAPIEEPKNWDPMNIGEGCKLVHVPVGSNEYDEVETKIKATCLKSCKEIIKIERVQNKSLFQQYAVNKLHMEASAGAGATTERILWHGTSEDTVLQINTNGFNRSYCGKNATYFGKGVYFARDWPYSAQDKYSPPNAQGFKFIYQARVLTGEFTLGTQEIIDAPLKPNETTKRFDSVVENVQNPTIFVIFRDTQVYPEYLITFI